MGLLLLFSAVLLLNVLFTGKKTICCSYEGCERKFYRESAMTNHLQTDHAAVDGDKRSSSDQKTSVTCTVGLGKFAKETRLRKHMNKHRNEHNSGAAVDGDSAGKEKQFSELMEFLSMISI